ncbi:MAG: RDD family protein [Acidobacteriota bacterium]|nr:RDD family protein [Acidobacteriota bacterium]
MINDSVREELVGKISVAAKKSLNFEIKINTMSNKTPEPVKNIAPPKPVAAAPKLTTSDLSAKSTNPTLIEFHNKNAAVPEWRLQLQNAVRQRQELDKPQTVDGENLSAAPRAKLVTSGANALKTETVEKPQQILHDNPDVARALQRIKDSRQKFLVKEEQSQPVPSVSAPKANKNYPFYIAGKTDDANVKRAEVNPSINSFAKPKLASSLRTEKEKLDTNKLPPLPKPAEISSSFETRTIVSEKVEAKIEEIPKTEIKLLKFEEIIECEETEIEEFDDYPTFAMRFNAGLFDLIIGSFSSLLLLSPFVFLGGDWVSMAGLFAFVATCAIVMFIYLTTTIGLYGKTFGMRLFSLEIVDLEGEDYPTFHQAAVSSSVYLLSLALGGIGFLTLPFNEDRRAVHDLVSGTIVVKED